MKSRVLLFGVVGALATVGCNPPAPVAKKNGRKVRMKTVAANVSSFNPNADVELTSWGSERPDDYAVELAFNQTFDGLDACVTATKKRRRLKPEAQLEGELGVEVKLNPKKPKPLGVNAKLPKPYAKDKKLESCIQRAVAKAPFPTYDGPPVVAEFYAELDPGSDWVEE